MHDVEGHHLADVWTHWKDNEEPLRDLHHTTLWLSSPRQAVTSLDRCSAHAVIGTVSSCVCPAIILMTIASRRKSHTWPRGVMSTA